jgi:hypothetical protein
MKKRLIIFFLVFSVLLSLTCQYTTAETISGTADMTPWSGYWWPISTGKLVNGYNGHPAPTEKADLIKYGTYPGNITRVEKLKGYDPSAVGWAGYCHAWANAATLEDISFKPSVHQGVFYAVGDKKGLLTLCHDEDPQIIKNCNKTPLPFHQYLLTYIGEARIPMVADLDKGAAVWSYPVYQYQMEILPVTVIQDGKEITAEDITCKIRFANDFVDPDFDGISSKSVTYNYRLYKDDNGAYTHGEWTGVDHPEWVWIPVTQTASNAFLDYEQILSIANAKDDELEGISKIGPGHYPLIIFPGEFDEFVIDLPAPCQYGISFALDEQSPLGVPASYELTLNGKTVALGDISETLETISGDVLTAGSYKLKIVVDEASNSSAFVRLYIDVNFNEQKLYLDIPSHRFWLGMAVVNQVPVMDNRLFVTYMGDNGLPKGNVSQIRKLSGKQHWSGVLTPTLPYDYFSNGLPALIKITSQHPISSLQIVGNESAIYGLPDFYPSHSGSSGKYVVPVLTRLIGSLENSKFTLHNANELTVQPVLQYYTNTGTPSGDATIDILGQQTLSYEPGRYPGNRDFGGWALIENVPDGIVGENQVRASIDKRYELPLLNTGNQFYIPYIVLSYGWKTQLVLYNPADAVTDVTISLLNAGQVLSQKELTLSNHERRTIDLTGEWLELPNDDAEKCWVQIESHTEIAGYVLYGFQNTSLVAFPFLDNEKFSYQKNLCHVSSDNIWWNSVAFLNPSNTAAEVSIAGYDSTGSMVSELLTSIDSGARMAGMVKNLFPVSHNNIRSLTITSNTPLGGLVAYGNYEGYNMLTGKVFE